MELVKIIFLFFATIVAMKHRKINLADMLNSKGNFFHKINEDIRGIASGVFIALNLSTKFNSLPKIKLYTTLLEDLHRAVEKNYEIYIEMSNVCKIPFDNTTINKLFYMNEVIDEILEKGPQFATKSSFESKNKTDYKFKNITEEYNDIENIDTPDFKNSEEFREFIGDLVRKVNSIKIEDFSKKPEELNDNVTRRNSFRRNLKVWRGPCHNKAKSNTTKNRRIYKGKVTRISKYPFMASIHIMNNFMCAGVIISADLILTAASCLQLLYNNRLFHENPKSVNVRIGTNYATENGDVIPAIEVHFYPAYNPENLRHNLAIIRIQRHIKLTNKKHRVRRILLDNSKDILPSDVSKVIILGWGAKDKRNVVGLMPKLAVDKLDVYNLEECKDIYSRHYVTDQHFCAGFVSKGGGACNRDVGGPGLVGSLLTGIISFGPPICGTLDAPTVFTKIGYYTDWVETIMEQDRPISFPRTTLRPSPTPQSVSPPRYTATTLGNIPPIDISRKRNRSEPIGEFLRKLLDNVMQYKMGLDDFYYDNFEDEHDDFAEMFSTTKLSNVTLLDVDQYDAITTPENNDEIFETTKAENLLEHPLINKSLLFMPEAYGIVTTSPHYHNPPTLTMSIPLQTETATTTHASHATEDKTETMKTVPEILELTTLRMRTGKVEHSQNIFSDNYEYEPKSDIVSHYSIEENIDHFKKSYTADLTKEKSILKPNFHVNAKGEVDSKVVKHGSPRSVLKRIKSTTRCAKCVNKAIQNHNWDSKEILKLLSTGSNKLRKERKLHSSAPLKSQPVNQIGKAMTISDNEYDYSRYDESEELRMRSKV